MASIAFGVSKSSASTARTVACVTDNLNTAQYNVKQCEYLIKIISLLYFDNNHATIVRYASYLYLNYHSFK